MRSTRPCARPARPVADAEALASLGATLPEAHRTPTDAPPAPAEHRPVTRALRPPPSAALPFSLGALVFGASAVVVMVDGGTTAEGLPLALVAAACVGGAAYEHRATRTPLDTQGDQQSDEGGVHRGDTMRARGAPGELR